MSNVIQTDREKNVHTPSPRRTSHIWWFIVIAVVLVLLVAVVIVIETTKVPPMSYSAFLDQLDADNIASVTFQGTVIEGHFKHPVEGGIQTGTQRNIFTTQVPDVGDPTLVPTLHKQHVVINVNTQSSWVWLRSVPWPILFFIGAAIVIGLLRLIRGGKAQSESAMPVHPMQGMVKLLSGLFGKQQQGENPPQQNKEK
jgi:ATP-dependent Zn protease